VTVKSQAEFMRAYSDVLNQAVKDGACDNLQRFMGGLIGVLEDRDMDEEEINEILQNALASVEVSSQ